MVILTLTIFSFRLTASWNFINKNNINEQFLNTGGGTVVVVALSKWCRRLIAKSEAKRKNTGQVTLMSQKWGNWITATCPQFTVVALSTLLCYCVSVTVWDWKRWRHSSCLCNYIYSPPKHSRWLSSQQCCKFKASPLQAFYYLLLLT